MAKNKKHQPKSKTVKKAAKQKSPTAQRKLQKVDNRLIAKRRDAIERPYYVHKQTGKRVSEKQWKAEDLKIKNQRDIRASQLLERSAETISPFPDGVSSLGIPERKITYDPTDYEGEAFEVDDFEPFAIEGDDETG